MGSVVITLNPEGNFDPTSLATRVVAEGVTLRHGTLKGQTGKRAGQALLFDEATGLDEQGALEWYEASHGMFAEDGSIEPVETMTDVEVFAAGVYDGIPFPEEAVRRLAETTSEVERTGREPFVGLGHSEKRMSPTERQRTPRLGTGRNIRYKAGKILADLMGVPRSLARAIRSGAYPKRSVEIVNDYVDNSGKRFPPLIESIRLLGQAHPRVKTLADVGVLYAGEDEYRALRIGQEAPESFVALRVTTNMEGERMPNEKPGTPEGADPRTIMIEKKELEALRADAEALKALKALKAKTSTDEEALKAKLKGLEDQRDAQAKRIAALEAQGRETEVDALLRELTHDGKLEPVLKMAERAHLLRLKELPAETTLTFAEDGKDRTVHLYDLRVAELRGRKPVQRMAEKARADAEPEETSIPTTLSEHEAAKKKAAEAEKK